MYIIDAWAWVEYFTGSEKGERVKKIVNDPKKTSITLDSTLAEVKSWALRTNADFDDAYLIMRINSRIESVEEDDWLRASEIRHEQRKQIKDFGLMDAIILAKQNRLKCKVVTGDPHLKGMKSIVFIE